MIDLGEELTNESEPGGYLHFSEADLRTLREIIKQIHLPEHIKEQFTGEATIAPIDWELVILWLQRAVAQIDKLIIRQLNHIIHHKKFQALEKAWRSLYDLVSFFNRPKTCQSQST